MESTLTVALIPIAITLVLGGPSADQHSGTPPAACTPEVGSHLTDKNISSLRFAAFQTQERPLPDDPIPLPPKTPPPPPPVPTDPRSPPMNSQINPTPTVGTTSDTTADDASTMDDVSTMEAGERG